MTYNQEKLVHRALDSLIGQRDSLYEICINDDCSTDGTFAVLEDYQRRFPGLVKPVRNEANLGIFRNIERLWRRPEGDIVYFLAGDDEVGEGWFRTVLDFIDSHAIDWKHEAFCIYGDFVRVYPDGRSFRFSNSAIMSCKDPLRLAVRGLVDNRSVCAGIKLYRRFVPVSDGRSYAVEMAQDRQLQLFADRNYYIPGAVGNIYHASGGVSVNLSEQKYSERQKIGEYLASFLEGQGRKMKKSDMAYLEYKKYTHIVSRHPSVGNCCRMLGWYLRSFSLPMFYPGRSFKKLLFILHCI